MKKLGYKEIMQHVKEDKKKLTYAHIKVIRQALKESDLDDQMKEYEMLTIKELENEMKVAPNETRR